MLDQCTLCICPNFDFVGLQSRLSNPCYTNEAGLGEKCGQEQTRVANTVCNIRVSTYLIFAVIHTKYFEQLSVVLNIKYIFAWNLCDCCSF